MEGTATEGGVGAYSCRHSRLIKNSSIGSTGYRDRGPGTERHALTNNSRGHCFYCQRYVQTSSNIIHSSTSIRGGQQPTASMAQELPRYGGIDRPES